MSPTDSIFLTVEARQRPMHVGGLHLYQPPADAGPRYAQDLFARLAATTTVSPLFRKRPVRSLLTGGQWAWEDDAQFDIEHHVRHNALPKPGRVLELLALCSRLHSTLLDRNRPLWEAHLIEGLSDGRFALYFKIHHALVDGVAAAKLLQSVLSTDPDNRDQPAPWAVPLTSTGAPLRLVDPEAPTPAPRPAPDLTATLTRQAREVVTETLGMPRALLTTVRRGLRDETAPVAFHAPKTILNVPITGSRRVAAQSWPIDRIKAAGQRRGRDSTVNDVVLAMCAGALRSYLGELDALPDSPLIAMVPVSLRSESQSGGNAVGAVMCNLATHLADPDERLAMITRSMNDGKQALREMTPLEIVAMTGVGVGPLLLQSVPGLHSLLRPPFNLIISNVPGPRETLYLNGSRLLGMYPLSIPFDGQALNITCTSYADELAFGLTGCRRSVPRLQRMLGFLEDSLSELEARPRRRVAQH